MVESFPVINCPCKTSFYGWHLYAQEYFLPKGTLALQRFINRTSILSTKGSALFGLTEWKV
jgi:hypothetical protein